MKVTVEQLPQRQAVLNIEAEEPEYEKARREAYQHILQRARVPGFRKGKAPMAMVERLAGKAAFLEEIIEHLIPEVTEKALEEHKLDVVGRPNLEIVTTEPVVWKATVDLVPEVDLRTYKDLRVQEDPAEATPEEVDASLEELRKGVAPWEPVSRPLELGDLITLDMVAKEGTRTLGEDKDAQYEVIGGSDRPGPGFAEALVGMSAGETREFDLTYPETDVRPEVAGKTVHFAVTIKDVKAKNIPALDDEFAKSVGEGFDSLDALRQRVTEQVVARKKNDARATLEDRAIQALIDGAKLNYSPGMVTHEAEHILEDQEEQFRRNKVSMENYLRSINKTREEMIAEMKPAAEQRLKRSLVLVELRKRENLEVSDEELNQEIDKMAMTSSEPDAIRRMFRNEAARASIRSSLLTRNTIDTLVDIVTQGGAAAESKEGAGADKPSS